MCAKSKKIGKLNYEGNKIDWFKVMYFVMDLIDNRLQGNFVFKVNRIRTYRPTLTTGDDAIASMNISEYIFSHLQCFVSDYAYHASIRHITIL